MRINFKKSADGIKMRRFELQNAIFANMSPSFSNLVRVTVSVRPKSEKSQTDNE